MGPAEYVAGGLAVYLALLLALIVLVPADRYPKWFSWGWAR
jgi:hypothetical protein